MKKNILSLAMCGMLAFLFGACTKSDPNSNSIANNQGHVMAGASFTAASCSEADVQAALNQATNGSTVYIPAGTCTWTTPLSYAPTGSINIFGAGNQSVLGGGDQTVIIDNVSRTTSDVATFEIDTSSSTSAVVRVSGITFEQNANSSQTYNGIVRVGGYSQNFRLDHNHFVLYSGNPSNICVGIFTWIYGVIDHNLFDMNTGTTNNGVRISHGSYANDTAGTGNGSWAAPSNFGSNNFIFYEDNTFNGGFANDCNIGGRFVFRHNTLNDSSTQAHEMESDLRGCRAYELYGNTYNGTASDTVDSTIAYETRMGTGLLWGNTLTGMHTFLDVANDRTNTGHSFGETPTSWGYCGPLVGTAGNVGPSNWDGNSDSTGYPCIDQVGRGQSDLLSGLFPNKVNSTTGTISWPHNKSEPVYEWMDQYTPAVGYSGGLCTTGDPNTIAPNRDFYCNTQSWNGSAFTGTAFNGTVGTGNGLLSARPSTCTTGVAYWATDKNTLYQCSSTNTWTAYYTPYTYPHPLVSGSPAPTPTPTPAPTPSPAPVPNPPTDLRITSVE